MKPLHAAGHRSMPWDDGYFEALYKWAMFIVECVEHVCYIFLFGVCVARLRGFQFGKNKVQFQNCILRIA